MNEIQKNEKILNRPDTPESLLGRRRSFESKYAQMGVYLRRLSLRRKASIFGCYGIRAYCLVNLKTRRSLFIVNGFYCSGFFSDERLNLFLQKVWSVKKGNILMLELILTMYLRHHNPKEMQKVAMDLAKADPVIADRHYMMAVFSLVMQV